MKRIMIVLFTLCALLGLVACNSSPSPSVTLSGIYVATNPTKMSYRVGESLDLTGMVVKGEYSDGTTKEIKSYTTSPENGTKLETTGSVKVTISYESKSTSITVTVISGNSHVVKFDSMGGSTVADQIVENGGKAKEPSPAPTKTANTFAGWYTNSLYTTAYDFSTPVTSDFTLYAKWIDNKNRVGGKIFYIADSNNDATYKFYQQDGSEITNWSKPTDLVNAYYYTKSGTSSEDKFYVYYEKIAGPKTWTYDNGSEWVFEDLSTGTVDMRIDGIGRGKINTKEMLLNHTDYIKSSTQMGLDCDTVWYYIDSINKANGGVGTEGCNDWFVPSKAELNELKTYTGYDKDATPKGTNSGNPNWFDKQYIWTSVEVTNFSSWSWDYEVSHWGPGGIKRFRDAVVAVRAF